MKFLMFFSIVIFGFLGSFRAQNIGISLNSSFPLMFSSNTSLANLTSNTKTISGKLSSVTIPLGSHPSIPSTSSSPLPPLRNKFVSRPVVNLNSNHPTLNELYPTREEHKDLSTAIGYLVKYLDRSNEGNQSSTWLKFVRNYDRQDCLLRLVCEINSNHEDASDSPLVNRIRKMFRQREAPSYRVKQDHAFPFRYAGHVGYSTGDAERCLEVFPVCSLSTEELLPLLSSHSRLLLPTDRFNKQLLPQQPQSSRKIPLAGLVPKQHPKMRRRMNELHQQFLSMQ